MERENTTRRPARYFLIDSIRGVAIMGVVLYHFLYDLNIVFGLDPAWVKLPLVQFWQEGTCCLFIMVSGFVWHLGKASCLRRGLQLNLLGLGITLLTFVFAPSQLILFGMLNFMGCAALLMLPLSGLADKLPPLFGMALGLMAFVFFHDVADGAVGLGALCSVALPEAWYESKILLPLGLPYPGFYSSDYFPLLPWFGVFAFGYYLYAYCLQKRCLQLFAGGEAPLLSWAGRHTLQIYLLHQIVCYPLAAWVAYVS